MDGATDLSPTYANRYSIGYWLTVTLVFIGTFSVAVYAAALTAALDLYFQCPPSGLLCMHIGCCTMLSTCSEAKPRAITSELDQRH